MAGGKGYYLENGIDVDLVGVGETDKGGLRGTFLELSHGSFHGWVLI
jgi:hypothetical protein